MRDSAVHLGTWRLAWCAVLFALSLLAATTLTSAPSGAALPPAMAAGSCLDTARESTSDPRSGTIPGARVDAVLSGVHLTGAGGQAERAARRLVQPFPANPLAPPLDDCCTIRSARPLTIPLLI